MPITLLRKSNPDLRKVGTLRYQIFPGNPVQHCEVGGLSLKSGEEVQVSASFLAANVGAVLALMGIDMLEVRIEGVQCNKEEVRKGLRNHDVREAEKASAEKRAATEAKDEKTEAQPSDGVPDQMVAPAPGSVMVVEPGEISDRVAYDAALASGTLTELTDPEPEPVPEPEPDPAPEDDNVELPPTEKPYYRMPKAALIEWLVSAGFVQEDLEFMKRSEILLFVKELMGGTDG